MFLHFLVLAWKVVWFEIKGVKVLCVCVCVWGRCRGLWVVVISCYRTCGTPGGESGVSLKLLRRHVACAEGFNSFWRVITKRTRLDRWESEVLESRFLTLSPTHRAHVIIKKNPWLSRSHLRLDHNFLFFPVMLLNY